MTEGMVRRRARIFRFGSYPKKDWAITAEQFVAANGATGVLPIGFDPIGLKHYEGQSSAFDGRTGTATYSVEGDEVFADIEWPSLLDAVADEKGLGFSGVFSRETSKLRKVDLVEGPHVPDAVLLADEPEVVIVFDDDEPEPEAEPVEFADHHDMAQMHHEIIAASHPHLCSNRHQRTVKFAKEHASERALRLVHDHSVHEGGAYCPGMGEHRHHHGEVSMADEVEMEEAEARIAELEAEVARLKGVSFAEEETPKEKALRERLERMEAEAVKKDAVAFAKDVTTGAGRRAYPAERATIEREYARNAAIDARSAETVTFADEAGKPKQGSHLDAFKASVMVRPVVAAKADDVVFSDLDGEPANGIKDEEAAREERRKKTQAWKALQGSTIG